MNVFSPGHPSIICAPREMPQQTPRSSGSMLGAFGASHCGAREDNARSSLDRPPPSRDGQEMRPGMTGAPFTARSCAGITFAPHSRAGRETRKALQSASSSLPGDILLGAVCLRLSRDSAGRGATAQRPRLYATTQSHLPRGDSRDESCAGVHRNYRSCRSSRCSVYACVVGPHKCTREALCFGARKGSTTHLLRRG